MEEEYHPDDHLVHLVYKCMEEDKGLDLSLGLPLGGSSSKSKDHGIFHTIDSVKPWENYFSNVFQASVDGDASCDDNGKRFWITSTKRSAEVDDEKGAGVGEKRKFLMEETNQQEEIEGHNSDVHGKVKISHLSITTDDGSTADNEDVAESAAEGSTSRLTSHHENSKWHVGGGSFSEFSKEVHGKLTMGAPPFPVQSLSTLNVPYTIPIKESALVGYPLPGKMQAMPCMNVEHPGSEALNVRNALLFGYPPVQPSTSDKDNSFGMAAPSLPFHPLHAPRDMSNSAVVKANHSLSEAVQPAEQDKSEAKQVAEECSSLRKEDDMRGSGVQLRGKAASEVPMANSFPSEYSAIRPGIAADIKFGGSGSLPSLPWVSTTGPGPNGRAISGATYKYNANQIKIVCACHGSHMSPEEFIRHAAEEQFAPDGAAGFPLVPTSNPSTPPRS
ncbi:hypothetical protein Nepgr_015534 [Nepenthes gracilis]|uniref:Ninja-family protein n=1 Tax=Nepenthes gracilis TaxID=150966 RepID=A0AAD3XQS4_NEPGR|nr:hypothetical protein Nepgr_015534 [Nepenthes gracilis]